VYLQHNLHSIVPYTMRFGRHYPHFALDYTIGFVQFDAFLVRVPVCTRDSSIQVCTQGISKAMFPGFAGEYERVSNAQ
jgi:hypothetical protein